MFFFVILVCNLARGFYKFVKIDTRKKELKELFLEAISFRLFFGFPNENLIFLPKLKTLQQADI